MLKLTDITLAALVVSDNETIRRNAMSILKQLQREQIASIKPCKHDNDIFGKCTNCGI